MSCGNVHFHRQAVMVNKLQHSTVYEHNHKGYGIQIEVRKLRQTNKCSRIYKAQTMLNNILVMYNFKKSKTTAFHLFIYKDFATAIKLYVRIDQPS